MLATGHFAGLIIIIPYISRIQLHFRKHFLVHLSHWLLPSSKSVEWVSVLHFIARKLRLRRIKVTVRKKEHIVAGFVPNYSGFKTSILSTSGYFLGKFAPS